MWEESIELISLALAFASGFVIAWTIKPDRKKASSLRPVEVTKNEVAINKQRQQIKEERKEQIITTIDNSDKITAREVQEMFAVSIATATRYLQELKKEGKIQEKGKGRSVHYTL